jgi:hypothetical protein
MKLHTLTTVNRIVINKFYLIFLLTHNLYQQATELYTLHLSVFKRNYIPTNFLSCKYERCLEKKGYSFTHGFL